MSIRSGSYLGLAFSDRGIACSEVVVNRDRPTIRRTALFAPSDSLFEKPEATGQALASFLRHERFRASRAVVGVPARWLLSSEREVPPAEPEQVRAVLRLHAERISVAENGGMVFDYTGRAEPARGGRVLLVGIQQQQLSRIEALLDSAGLRIAAITPTSVALAAAMEDPASQPMLVLARQGAELVWPGEGGPRLLRHVPIVSFNGHGMPAMGPLGSELRRTMALSPVNGAAPREVTLWDAMGLSEEQKSELATRMGVALRAERGLGSLGLNADDDHPGGELLEQYGPALALALAGARHRELPLDFRHSRLALPRQRRFGRRSFWMGAIAATLVLVIGALAYSVQQKKSELAGIQRLLDLDQDRFEAAKLANERFNTAQKYFDRRMPALELLREITLAFREDEPNTYATGITLRDTGKGQLVGKSSDQRTPLLLGERLRQNRDAFANAQTTQVVEQQAPGGRTKEQAFTITFEYKGAE